MYARTGQSVHKAIIIAVLGTCAALLFSLPAASAQLQGDAPTGNTSKATMKDLNFFLRLNDEDTGTTTTQPVNPTNPGANAGTNGTRNLNVNVTVIQGEKQAVLPLNVTIPAEADDVDLCASVANGTEVCQAILVTLDLTQPSKNSTGTASVTPAAYMPVQDSGGLLGDGSLIHIEDTNVFIPVTVIVPLTVQIQNAQVCASVLSSGEMNCTQAVLNPSQTSYTNVDVDVSQPTPALTSSPATTTAEQTPTTQAPPSNTTGTDNTTPDSGGSSTTQPSGGGNTTNSTG